MSHLLTLIDRLSRLAETAAVILIFGYCGLMLTEVVARAQAQSFSFIWEFSQYAMAAIFALASGSAIRTGVHLRITVLAELIPPPFQKALNLMANAVALIIVALMVSALWTKAFTSFEKGNLATSVTKAPLWVPRAVVLWGITQLWLDLAARLLRRFIDLPYEIRNADAEPSDF